jgi:hypothetical protein
MIEKEWRRHGAQNNTLSVLLNSKLFSNLFLKTFEMVLWSGTVHNASKVGGRWPVI